MNAIRWAVDAADLAPRLHRGVLPFLLRRQLAEHRKRRAAGARHVAYAEMVPITAEADAPNGVGLYAYCVRGSVPVHTDPGFAPWTHLWLIRPGPYAVVDAAFDRTPQAAGTLIAFNSHESHALFYAGDSDDALVAMTDRFQERHDASEDEPRGFEYARPPSPSWCAVGFDSVEELTPEAARARLVEKLDRMTAGLEAKLAERREAREAA